MYKATEIVLSCLSRAWLINDRAPLERDRRKPYYMSDRRLWFKKFNESLVIQRFSTHWEKTDTMQTCMYKLDDCEVLLNSRGLNFPQERNWLTAIYLLESLNEIEETSKKLYINTVTEMSSSPLCMYLALSRQEMTFFIRLAGIGGEVTISWVREVTVEEFDQDCSGVEVFRN